MSTVVTTVKWAWAAVDAATPAPPGVIGIDGTTLVVSVATADGQDVSDVLAGLTPGDIVSVADQATGGGGPVTLALDDLTDVDVSLSATGMLLTKQLDGSWKGANFTRPLNWLTDVVAPADAQGVLGTTAPGQWEPLPMDHLQQQIVGPLPGQVAALDQRIAALEVTPEPAPVDHALTVDNYSGGFTRIIGAQVIGTDPVRITVSLATTPGVNGTVFADLSAISGSANVWADFAGTLGRVEDALTGTPIHGAALKEVIRRGTVVICHRDNTDPAHPTLKVDGTEAAGQPGTSLTLASLADVDNAASTAPAGKVLGTTGTGAWGPVDPPSGGGDPRAAAVAAATLGSATLPPEWTPVSWQAGSIVTHEGHLYRATQLAPGGHVPGTSTTRWERFDLPTVWDKTAAPPGGGTDPRLTEVVAATYGAADLPPAWVAQAYPVGATVTHNSRVWTAPGEAPRVTDEPGVSGFRWVGADATHLRDLLEAAVGQPQGIAEWVPTQMYTSSTVVSHNGRLWRGAAIAAAGREPGVDPAWESFDLASSVDPTGLSTLVADTNSHPAGMLAHAFAAAWGATLPAVWIARRDNTVNLPNGHTSTADWRRVTPAENAKAIHEVDVSKWGMWSGDQAAYDALPTKSATVLYVITP